MQRADDRRTIELSSGVRWERLTPTHDSTVDFLKVVYAPGGQSSDSGQAVRHDGREYLYVLRGELEAVIGFDTFRLLEGDSVAFDPTTPITTETLRQRSSTPCTSSYTSTRHNAARGDPSSPLPDQRRRALNHNTIGGPEADGPRRVGFIGLGNMGSAMAARLIEAGYHVTVWARTASNVDGLVERGAARGQDPEDAIGTGVVFSMLSNDDAVRQVFTPARLNAAPEGVIHVNHATISPSAALEFASIAEGNGSRYVSAPVLGRPEAVVAGKAAILASGEPEGARGDSAA